MRSLLGWMLVLAAVTACRDQGRLAAPATAEVAPARPDHMIGGRVVPRVYEVPPGRAADLRRLFRTGAMSYAIAVVSQAGAQTQFVRPEPAFLGDTRVVIGAPAEYHVEIEKLIGSLGGAPAAASLTYDMTFWVVEAIEAPETAVDPSLAELQPTLAAMTGLGKRRFRLIDRASMMSLVAEETRIKGRLFNVRQTLIGLADRLEADLTIEAHSVAKAQAGPLVVETKLQLQADKPVVLGDSTLAADDGATSMILYVVRAHRVD